MTILTKTQITKNESANFSLDKTELAQIESVSTNSYFSNVQNWKKIKLVYVSGENKQREVVVFNAEGEEQICQSSFLISNKADDFFQIRKIVIEDFDGGYHEIMRDELNTEEFDVVLSVVYTRSLTNATLDENLSEYTWGNLVFGSSGIAIVGDSGFGFDNTTVSIPGVVNGKVYKLRVYIAEYSGSLVLSVDTDRPEWSNSTFNAAQLSSAVGGYVETYLPTYEDNSNYLYFYNDDANGNGSITISKIELIEDEKVLPQTLQPADFVDVLNPSFSQTYDATLNAVNLTWNTPVTYTKPYVFNVRRRVRTGGAYGPYITLVENLTSPEYSDTTVQSGAAYEYLIILVGLPQDGWGSQSMGALTGIITIP